MWTDLKGWDRPDAKNEERALLFQRDIYRRGNIALPYRYFQGSGKGELPLVMFLHGADAVGEDNESQLTLHDVGTIFADPAWQKKHPCHIIAPQYNRGMHWANPVMTECLQAFVEYAAERFSSDRTRTYLYGYSAGAIGLFSLLKRFPESYAAAIPICGSTTGENLEQIAKTPVWMFHAADDGIVPAGKMKISLGYRENLGSRILAEELGKIKGAEVHYTEYPAGEMMEKHGLHAHCSWVLAGRDEKAKEWMFSKVRK